MIYQKEHKTLSTLPPLSLRAHRHNPITQTPTPQPRRAPLRNMRSPFKNWTGTLTILRLRDLPQSLEAKNESVKYHPKILSRYPQIHYSDTVTKTYTELLREPLDDDDDDKLLLLLLLLLLIINSERFD
jgi:hypothetical protein